MAQFFGRSEDFVFFLRRELERNNGLPRDQTCVQNIHRPLPVILFFGNGDELTIRRDSDRLDPFAGWEGMPDFWTSSSRLRRWLARFHRHCLIAQPNSFGLVDELH